jgi:hypothetical protein
MHRFAWYPLQIASSDSSVSEVTGYGVNNQGSFFIEALGIFLSTAINQSDSEAYSAS